MTPSVLKIMPRSKRAKWKIFRIFVSLISFLRLGAEMLLGRNLHDIGRAVAGRKLHHAEPVAPRIETHRLGVDRDGGARVAREVGKIAAVLTDGH